MARGTEFGGLYTGNSFRLNINQANIKPTPVAQMILEKNNIPHRSSIVGSALSGYDIKSQDSVTMLRLSLLAEGEVDGFPEVYCDRQGIATVVYAGTNADDQTAVTLEKCFLKTASNNFITKIDHVLVKGKDPLPKKFTTGSVNVMSPTGAPGRLVTFQQSACAGGNYPTKDNALKQEAWAEFGRSPQSKETLDALKALVKRSKWQSLLGYKVRFEPVESWVSISLSQTTPRTINVPFSSQFNTSILLPIGDNLPDMGGIVDISGLNATGAQVLDLVPGSTLIQQFPSLQSEGGFTFDDQHFFCLLNHECSILSISRGTNWYLLQTNNPNTAQILLRKGGSSKDAVDVFNDFDFDVYFFRRKDGDVASMADVINANIQNGDSPLETNGGVARSNPFRGEIIAGLGGSLGIELFSLDLAYSIASPSIAVKSMHADAAIWAEALRNGVTYTAIAVTDAPAPTGWNGKVIYPVAPPEEEGVAYEVDSPIDELEGTVIDFSAPYLGEEGVKKLSSKLFTLINGDSGKYFTLSYARGGYELLPGMRLPEGVINSIEITYNDKDSVSTNISTGPLYYPIGSYNDSQYVKRSETISRDAWVVAGSNADGSFIVQVEGLGRYEAINGDLNTIYPGDKVEVRLINVPIELN